jgi:hypothetical protein
MDSDYIFGIFKLFLNSDGQQFINIIKMNNHLSPQIIKHKKRPCHMTLEIQILVRDRHKKVVGSNRLMGPNLPLLNNSISNEKKNLCRFTSTQEITHHHKNE